MFQCLFDGDVISEESFLSWETSDDQAEFEGRGVAITSTTQFFTWLKENMEENEDWNYHLVIRGKNISEKNNRKYGCDFLKYYMVMKVESEESIKVSEKEKKPSSFDAFFRLWYVFLWRIYFVLKWIWFLNGPLNFIWIIHQNMFVFFKLKFRIHQSLSLDLLLQLVFIFWFSWMLNLIFFLINLNMYFFKLKSFSAPK